MFICVYVVCVCGYMDVCVGLYVFLYVHGLFVSVCVRVSVSLSVCL